MVLEQNDDSEPVDLETAVKETHWKEKNVTKEHVLVNKFRDLFVVEFGNKQNNNNFSTELASFQVDCDYVV